MNDIMAEVDAAMRQDRMEKFWRENGRYILMFAVATVIMTGVISAYRTWDRSVKIADTETLLTLTQAKDYPANLKGAKLDMRAGLRGVALVNGAQEFLKKDKTEDALALYNQAVDDGAIPEEIRGLAVLQLVRLTENASENEKLMKQLQSVALDGGSPWQYHARVEAASFSAAKADYKMARNYLAGVMDERKVPDTLYKKAQALDHVYALKEQEQKAQEPKQESKKEEKEGT